jgi:hypothetical protein
MATKCHVFVPNPHDIPLAIVILISHHSGAAEGKKDKQKVKPGQVRKFGHYLQKLIDVGIAIKKRIFDSEASTQVRLC